MSVGEKPGHGISLERVIVSANHTATIDQNHPRAMYRTLRIINCRELETVPDQSEDRFLVSGQEIPALQISFELCCVIP